MQWTMPALVPGRFEQAGSFDGIRTVRWVADFPFPDSEGSMEAWVWLPAQSQASGGTILRVDGTDPWTYHVLYGVANTRRVAYRTFDGRTVGGVESGELSSGWHSLLATHSAARGRIELFVDGISQGSADYRMTACKSAVLDIGGIPPAASGTAGVRNPFRGLIDEVRVSSVVRKPEKDAAPGPHVADQGTTVLIHFDEHRGSASDPGIHPEPFNPPDYFGDNGSLFAVYDFLERFCGVRWYLPTDLGTVIPRRPTLTVVGSDVRRAPAMPYRWIAPTTLQFSPGGKPIEARDNDLWRLRMRLGGLPFRTGHSFYGYYDRFLKTHPEWFAQGYAGKPPQMCYTNPDFIAQVVRDARDYFDGRGAQEGAQAMGDYFALVPMDNTDWCKCDRCRAELNRDKDANQQFNNGRASNYIWGFVDKVAREVRKTHPTKWIVALAYSDYAYYPTTEGIEANVAVQLCLHFRNWWAPSMERNDLKILDQYTRDDAGVRQLFLWLYYCFPALSAKLGNFGTFPGFFAPTALRQMELSRRAGIRGIFLEHSSEIGQSMLGDLPELYLTLKLADDPTLDAAKALDEFFTLYYGGAAEPMKRLYDRMAETYSNPANYPDSIRLSPASHHQTEELAWRYLGTPARMAEFGALLADARRSARTDAERQRITLFERGVWQPMVVASEIYANKTKK